MISSARVFLLLCSALSAASLLLPYPQGASLGEGSINIDGSFQFSIVGSSNVVIDSAIKRYSDLISVPASSSGSLKVCYLSVSNADADVPIIGSDESHKLSISEAGDCSISAQTTWGLLHGLETFTHLLIRSSSGDIELDYVPVSIEDSPRFQHRGLMIDSARHYLPVKTIRHLIDSLPMSKFNVLHWHTVDAESFPLKVGVLRIVAKYLINFLVSF